LIFYLIDDFKSVADKIVDRNDAVLFILTIMYCFPSLLVLSVKFLEQMLYQHLRIFNYAGIVLNSQRTSLLTDIANKLIVGACRRKNTLRSELKSSMLPNIGELEIDLIIAKEAVEEYKAAKEFWDDIFLVN